MNYTEESTARRQFPGQICLALRLTVKFFWEKV